MGGGSSDPQFSLFAAPAENPPLRQAIEFYKHRHNWSNRLIAGDSLLVMNSLIEKEGLGGRVQTVYIDPPYGIRYGSNFQPFVNRRDVADGKDEDLTQEPEQIRAFRDTWELGVHSYLAYLRDRLLLARDLLRESGNCFVQIGDENVHRAGLVMDEVFGAQNRVATISYATTGASSTSTLPQVADYLLWYAKDRKQAKYRQLYEPLTRAEIIEFFTWNVMVELPDGTRRKPTREERFDPDAHLPDGARIYQRMPLDSQGVSTTGRSEPYEYKGRVFQCGRNRQWAISKEGIGRLAERGRLDALEGHSSLMWKLYEDEVPGRRIHNIWAAKMSPRDKRYVVQTAPKPIQRAVLMTTDPGDLVFDPTCGSGTSAYVAEQWGRRWIACDTSRVALATARQRLMTASYDYYELAHPDEGVGSGFRCRSVAAVSASTLGYDEPPKETTLYDQPLIDRAKVRVTGPFTVEAVPAPAVKPLDDMDASESLPADDSVARSGPTVRQGDWRDELLKTGIRGKAGQRISLARLEPLPAARWLHAEGETRPDGSGADSFREAPAAAHEPARLVVSFGPDHAPLEQRQVARAVEEAQSLVPRPQLIVFAAFQFDPEAAKDIDETRWPGVALLKAQMNADLLTGDLKKKRASNESFWLIGQPDVTVVSEKWLVNGSREALAPHDIVAKLSGVDRPAEINGLGRDDLSLFIAVAQRRDLWAAGATDEGGGVRSGQHRRGAGETRDGGVSSFPGRRAGLPGRIGDAGDFVRELALLSETDRRSRVEGLRGNREIAERTRQVAASLTGQLSTVHYSQVSVHGFDYYNTRTGTVDSGGEKQIAMWMLDPDYDGRSLFPRQVFFLTVDGERDVKKLAKNLKAEIAPDLIDAYLGAVSLPFEAGGHRRAAVKIVDDRGIESLKILDLDG